MSELWVNTVQAAAIVGLGRRQFERKYLNTDSKVKIKVYEFPAPHNRCRHMFLRKDVEALKK